MAPCSPSGRSRMSTRKAIPSAVCSSNSRTISLPIRANSSALEMTLGPVVWPSSS